MLKRLIEVALPLKEVSEQSAREKSIRHGHISTLHIWWARRPLAACRAVIFASLIPDPDDPECPEHFRQLVRTELADSQFKPKDSNGSTIEDTPRNRCLEFIKHLVRWENSNEPHYIEPARKLIKEAHKIFHPDSDSDVPKVLDPFAGGGAIPLEALRLGCEAHAIDINPVAHLIELCTLVYPQKFGKLLPKDKPIPYYIKELIAHNRAKGKDKSHATLFEKSDEPGKTNSDGLFPDVEISEDEYRKNPLAADVKYWGHWILEHAKRELKQFYPPDEDGSVPVAYLWARTVKCPNPACGSTVPLVRQLWLCKKKNRKVAMKMTPNPKTKQCDFEVVEGNEIDFDPEKGTVQQGQSECPFCKTTSKSKYIQEEGNAERIGQQLLTVVMKNKFKKYRNIEKLDLNVFRSASLKLSDYVERNGNSLIPNEAISKQQPRVMWITLYGIRDFGKLFNSRQLFTLITLTKLVRGVFEYTNDVFSTSYAKAISTYLAFLTDRVADYCNSVSRWDNSQERNVNLFSRQALPMVWDYGELNPLSDAVGSWLPMLNAQLRIFDGTVKETCDRGFPKRGSATALPMSEKSIQIVVTDPPYYDAVPYSDLSDFFYVWLKRTLGNVYPDLLRTPVTPKKLEAIEERPHKSLKTRKDKNFYEECIKHSFEEAKRVLVRDGLAAVMFAHKSTSAWETLIASLLNSGLLVTGSWPIHTEQKNRMIARGTAALASSVTIVCRKRAENADEGFWDDVRKELRGVANERLDFFWNQGIRGADFFISAIGPALSVFGKHEKVVRLSGEPVTVKQFLEEVRSVVTEYALDKIIKQSGRGQIDPETRLYVVWRWSYGDAKVPADEAFTLAKALGLDTEMMWDRTGTLEKGGQNVQAIPIAKRMSISNLGEPEADGSPGSIVDVLHRMCSYRDKGDTTALTEFLARSGHGRNETLWLVAQAISEILPDGDKEKQLLQGLLNQRDGIMEAARDAKLF